MIMDARTPTPDTFPTAVREYFATLSREEPEPGREERIAWRYSCFESGLGYADYVMTDHFPLKGRRVLDVACAWGGHALAFASRGAEVVGTDLNNHRFDLLSNFAREHRLPVHLFMGNCECIPLQAATVDVVVGLELVEHISSVDAFAESLFRVLRPGGIAILSTPPRLRSLFWGEPHYGIRGLTLLPFPLQRPIATRIFRKGYPYPIPRQYTRASSVIRPFAARGLSGFPVIRGRLARRVQNNRWLSAAVRELLWNFIVVVKAAPAA